MCPFCYEKRHCMSSKEHFDYEAKRALSRDLSTVKLNLKEVEIVCILSNTVTFNNVFFCRFTRTFSTFMWQRNDYAITINTSARLTRLPADAF